MSNWFPYESNGNVLFQVPFVVSRGRVYLDIMGAFTLLGELRMAMPNKWEAVDKILQVFWS